MTVTEFVRVPVPEAIRQEVMLNADYACHYCNRQGQTAVDPDGREWHIDHKTAVANGGGNEIANLALACVRCNLSKRNRDYDEFRAYARSAYWVDRDTSLSAAVLESLARTWASLHPAPGRRGESPEFHFGVTHDSEFPNRPQFDVPTIWVVDRLADGTLDESSRMVALAGDGLNSRNAAELLRFVELTYRHMPAILDALHVGADARDGAA